MTTPMNKQLLDILKDMQSNLVDTFFEEKRRERMRPNLSRQDEDEVTVVSIRPLTSCPRHAHRQNFSGNVIEEQ